MYTVPVRDRVSSISRSSVMARRSMINWRSLSATQSQEIVKRRTRMSKDIPNIKGALVELFVSGWLLFGSQEASR